MSQDGFGTRTLTFDPESGDPVEVLTFTRGLASRPDFGAAVGERVARLARIRHTMYARTRRIDRPAENSLLLYSDHVAGWRLDNVLDTAERHRWTLEIGTILGLLRQLIPAVALFSRHQRDAVIGTIGPERLILTPQGRLVIAEYVLAPGLEKLQYSRERLWRELRVAVPPAFNPTKFPPAADVIGIGVVALSLLLGRRLSQEEYLMPLGEVFDSLTETSGGQSRKLSPTFNVWLARTLQFEGDSSYQSTQEAQVAFEEMLAKETTYVTSPAALNEFLVTFERRAGHPPAPRPSPPEPEAEPEPEQEPIASAPSAIQSPAPARVAAASATPSRPAAALASAPAPAPAPSPPPPPALSPAPAPAPAPAFTSVSVPTVPTLAAPATVAPAPSARVSITAPFTPEPSVVPAGAAPSIAPEPQRVATVAAPNSSLSGFGIFGSTPAEEKFAEVAAAAVPAWRKYAIPALVALALVEAAAIGWLLSTGGSGMLNGGELVVQSRPAAARVTIDGEERGITPYTTELSPGSHIVEIRVGRSEPRVIPVMIRGGVQTGMYVELQSVATVGGLEVRTDPPKALVTVAGQERGVTPLVLNDLPPGEVEVVVRHRGREVRQMVRIEPGITSQLVVPLTQ